MASESLSLADKRRMVQRGIALGFVGIGAVLGVAYAVTPSLGFPSAGDRAAFALRCSTISTLMLLAGIGAVANMRYATEAIDPLAGTVMTGRMEVHKQYLENTLQQLVLHIVAIVGLAIDGTSLGLRLLPGLVACFVLGRVIFWVGYLRDPMKRAPGFTMTMQPSTLTLLYLAAKAIWLIFLR